MAVEHWVAGSGQGLGWGSCFGSEINSVVSGNAVLSSVSITNGTALDLFGDLSISLGSITPGSGSPYIGFSRLPLNQDGSSYGDGRFGTSAAGPPPSPYYIGSILCIPSTAGVLTGTISFVMLPPGTCKFLLYNLAGATLASSANTVSYRTYDRSVV